MFHIDYDPKINAKNIADTGLDFELAWGFDWTTATLCLKIFTYKGESYYRAIGAIRGRLYQLIFQRDDDTVCVYGLRRLMKGEEQTYGEIQKLF